MLGLASFPGPSHFEATRQLLDKPDDGRERECTCASS